jgi:Skp family chaperone for outer membrane proteins
MATPWDDSLKVLFSEHAQDFASWVLEGAEVLNKLSAEFVGRKAVADGLLEVRWKGKKLLMHFEFQSTNDPDMPERVLDYALRAKREHRRAVYSCLIYLRDVGEVPPSPLAWHLTEEYSNLNFDYLLIELAKMTPEQFKQIGLLGLFPLMLLTKGGNTQEIAEEVVSTLEAEGKREALSATAILASLVLHGDGDLDWFERRFAAMEDDSSLEESWILRKYMNKAREQERQALQEELQQQREALQEERQALQGELQQQLEALQGERAVLQEERQKQREFLQGERQKALQDLRDLFVNIVERRFTDTKLALMARGRASALQDFKVLEHLIFTMSVAQNAQEAEQALLS